jgi:hypothetical protein
MFDQMSPQQQKLAQKMAEVDKAKQKEQQNLSFNMWKHVNPGYVNSTFTTTNKDDYSFTPEDYQGLDRTYSHKKDKHTEYVEYLIRDQHLKRGGGAGAPAK